MNIYGSEGNRNMSGNGMIEKVLFFSMFICVFCGTACGFIEKWLFLPIFLGVALILMSVLLVRLSKNDILTKNVAAGFTLAGICCFIFSGFALYGGIELALAIALPIIFVLIFGGIGIALLAAYKKNKDTLFLGMGIAFIVVISVCIVIYAIMCKYMIQ